MLNALTYILPFLILITPIVFFHELGHFSVARFFGVKIETFSIGFGREIFGFTDRKGTRWKFSWLPLGGYVKFWGDADAASTPDRSKLENATPAELAGSLFYKPVWQRMLITVAGPVANFILAMVIFTGLYLTFGVGTPAAVVGVIAGQPAKDAGLQVGDHIAAIGGKPVKDWFDMKDKVQAAKGKPVVLSVLRKGKPLTLTAHPQTLDTTDIYGSPVKYWGMGIEPSDDDADLIMTRVGLGGAVVEAGRHVEFVCETSLTYIWRIFTGRANTSQLTGPVGMVQVAHKVAKKGWMDLLGLAAFISVSIGLVNLFPIPVLDGGHLLYYGVEAARGRPLNAKAQDAGFRLGLAVVLGLLLLATFNDLVRPNLF